MLHKFWGILEGLQIARDRVYMKVDRWESVVGWRLIHKIRRFVIHIVKTNVSANVVQTL
jgi:hypothetical protein